MRKRWRAVRATGRTFLFVRTKWYLIGMKKSVALIALMLCGCGEQRPPAPTAEEDRQLDEAEAMLNAEANATAIPNSDEGHRPSPR